jgi:hypothetical protein
MPPAPMDIRVATSGYERWLAAHLRPVAADLAFKHARMREAAFPFMRATYYRWCQRWHVLAPGEQRAARVSAVGDLHLENFGTWRDLEGRLVWGVNDFDEVATLGWSQDLARLATSAELAIADGRLRVRRREACAAILDGYREGVRQGSRPFTLEERNGWLRRVAMNELRDPVAFWGKMDALRTARDPDEDAVRALAAALPAGDAPVRICRRTAGMGSLGRPRFVAIADWRGGRVAREVKAFAPTAWVWARGLDEIAGGAPAASEDPTVRRDGRWLVRRLAPHCTRIELTDLPRERDEEKLLSAMGLETANVHVRLASRATRERLRRELAARKDPRWLHELAKIFSDEIQRDFQAFRAG